MAKYRFGYAMFLLALATLVYYSAEPFLLALLVILLVFTLLEGLLALRDTGAVHMRLEARPGGQQGNSQPFALVLQTDHALWATSAVQVDIRVENVMFGAVQDLHFLLPIQQKQARYVLPFTPDQCGRLAVTCKGASICDLLHVFQIKTQGFDPVQTLIYPRRLQLEVELTRETAGSPRGEGLMLNRKGSDPSEMYDIREYTPGDDVRAIHWKLSSKTDSMILRQASDPAHYNVVLLPDLGLVTENGTDTTPAERNTAVACGAAVALQLLRRGIGFCVALPGARGLELQEVHSGLQYQQLLTRWLSTPVPKTAGENLQVFITERLDSNFTRLVLLSAGGYSSQLPRLQALIGVTAINAGESVQAQNMTLNGNSILVEVPANAAERDGLRILC